jgi:hypothetical protein
MVHLLLSRWSTSPWLLSDEPSIIEDSQTIQYAGGTSTKDNEDIVFMSSLPWEHLYCIRLGKDRQDLHVFKHRRLRMYSSSVLTLLSIDFSFSFSSLLSLDLVMTSGRLPSVGDREHMSENWRQFVLSC